MPSVILLPSTEKYHQSSALLENDYLLGFWDIPDDRCPNRNQVQFIAAKDCKNLLSIAPTRSGKGASLILPNLLNLPDHSIFVIDPKGENALVSAAYRRDHGNRVLIFNPFGIHQEDFADRGFKQFQCFNPLAHLDVNSPSLTDDIALIAEALIYEAEADREPHWPLSARGLIEFLIQYLVFDPAEEKTFRRLRLLIAGGQTGLTKEWESEPGEDTTDEAIWKTTDESGTKVRVRRSIAERAQQSPSEEVRPLVDRYCLETNEIHGIFATAETQTRFLKSAPMCAALAGEPFDFSVMKREKVTIYLILPFEYMHAHGRYLRLILLMAIAQLMRTTGGRSVLMILDEFAQLGPLPTIERAYAHIAGYGVTLWTFIQNLTQLQALYPINWEAFISNSSVITLSNTNDNTTAEYFSRRVGHEYFNMADLSRSVAQQLGHNPYQDYADQWTERNRMPLQAFYDSDPEWMWIFFEGQAAPLSLKKLKYFADQPFLSRAKSNPLHQNESNRITSVYKPVNHKTLFPCRILEDKDLYYINTYSPCSG